MTMLTTLAAESTGSFCRLRIFTNYKQSLLPKRSQYKLSKSCKPVVMKMVPITIWLLKSCGNPHQKQLAVTSIASIWPAFETTIPTIIRPPANNKAIRTPLQATQGYSRYDVNSKIKPNLLLSEPIWAQGHISKMKSRCG